MITSCRPEDSPTFLHERPDTLSFDIVFNQQPYVRKGEKPDGAKVLDYLAPAIKLKAVTLDVEGGTRSQIQLSPASIYSNNKEYREDEFHVSVVFDVAEFARSASEKLLHAQLDIKTGRLVDADDTEFALDHYLEMRGLPIYVFEETDVAQVVKEESEAVQEAVQDEAVG